jgi:hypothetical protein
MRYFLIICWLGVSCDRTHNMYESGLLYPPPPHVGCGILRDSLAIFFISVISSYNSPKYLFVYTKPVLQTATSPPTIFVDLFHDYTTAKLEGVIKTGQSA